MRIEITKKQLPGIIIWVIYAAVLFMNLDLIFGSYAEMEPKAGNIFAVITGLVVLAGPVLYFLRRKSKSKAA